MLVSLSVYADIDGERRPCSRAIRYLLVGNQYGSLAICAVSFCQASDAELDRRLHFFGEGTTVRRVYLRLLAHAHEHMGQMIAYRGSMAARPVAGLETGSTNAELSCDT